MQNFILEPINLVVIVVFETASSSIIVLPYLSLKVSWNMGKTVISTFVFEFVANLVFKFEYTVSVFEKSITVDIIVNEHDLHSTPTEL